MRGVGLEAGDMCVAVGELRVARREESGLLWVLERVRRGFLVLSRSEGIVWFRLELGVYAKPWMAAAKLSVFTPALLICPAVSAISRDPAARSINAGILRLEVAAFAAPSQVAHQ